MRDREEDPGPGPAASAATASGSEVTRWAIPAVDAGGKAAEVQRPVAVTTSEQARASVLEGLRCASPQVVTLAGAVAGLVDQDTFGDLGAAAQLNDDLIGLARITQVLVAETARRVHAADRHDVTATGVRATLAAQGWSGKATWASLTPARSAPGPRNCSVMARRHHRRADRHHDRPPRPWHPGHGC